MTRDWNQIIGDPVDTKSSYKVVGWNRPIKLPVREVWLLPKETLPTLNDIFQENACSLYPLYVLLNMSLLYVIFKTYLCFGHYISKCFVQNISMFGSKYLYVLFKMSLHVLYIMFLCFVQNVSYMFCTLCFYVLFKIGISMFCSMCFVQIVYICFPVIVSMFCSNCLFMFCSNCLSIFCLKGLYWCFVQNISMFCS